MVKIIRTSDKGFSKTLGRVLSRGGGEGKVEESVRRILLGVKKNGDRALVAYTKEFDCVDIGNGIKVKESEIRGALKKIPAADLKMLKLAAKRIASFHKRELERSWSITDLDGVTLGRKVTPLKKAGIYVPGGKAAYPSTVLMNAIPAKVAGVDEVVMATPPSKGGINPYVLAAAEISGVDSIYGIGGAQAIGALAYSTETVPAVDKITGPGNIYVATAKRLVFGTVDIDMIAGPSEILIINDGAGNPAWIAADMLSQAEHDEIASSILVTTSLPMAKAVKEEITRQIERLERRTIAMASIRRRGVIIVARDTVEAAEIADLMAPEHLELYVKRPAVLMKRIRNAGAIFLGALTPEAAGDYLAGPNHTLPTGGTARFSSPLGVRDFMKSSSVIGFSKKALKNLGPAIARLARVEGLTAHAKSVEMRLEDL
ncbi:MAG: histidinol dehydrogenase [Deltaproteobacteria bacterium]|nr:histidinol dehydrogenase [Deltaproteobacteria bacterium]